MASPDETRIVRSKALFEHAILPENKDQIAQLFDDPTGFLELMTAAFTLIDYSSLPACELYSLRSDGLCKQALLQLCAVRSPMMSVIENCSPKSIHALSLADH